MLKTLLCCQQLEVVELAKEIQKSEADSATDAHLQNSNSESFWKPVSKGPSPKSQASSAMG